MFTRDDLVPTSFLGEYSGETFGDDVPPACPSDIYSKLVKLFHYSVDKCLVWLSLVLS